MYRVQTTDGQITDETRTRTAAVSMARYRAQNMQETFLVLACTASGWVISEIVERNSSGWLEQRSGRHLTARNPEA